jgi:hypothetical protein
MLAQEVKIFGINCERLKADFVSFNTDALHRNTAA